MPNRKLRTGWYRLRSGGLYHGPIPAGADPIPVDQVVAELDAAAARAEVLAEGPPPRSAPKAAWQAYALTLAPDADSAAVVEEMSKRELVEFVEFVLTQISGSPAATHTDEGDPDDSPDASA